MTHIDDFNHWGLVARHLLRHDRFPYSADQFINFQSYPLGTACFIYFIARPIGEIEGVFFIAQNLLLWFLFLPMFALIRNDRRVLLPIAAGLFLIFFSHSCKTNALTVDTHLIVGGICMAAIAAYHRDDFKRAVAASILPMIAVTFFKSSGMFFVLCTALLLIGLARRNRCGSKRIFIALILLPLACYLLWTVSIMFRFPHPLYTKHSISPKLYLRQLREKGLSGVLQITLAMLRSFVLLYPDKIVALCLVLFFAALLIISRKRLTLEQRRACLSAGLFSVGLYLAWYFLLYFMYLFSMPTEEAAHLASFTRYDFTGFSYAASLLAIPAILSYQEAQPLARAQRIAASSVSGLSVAALLLLIAIPNRYVPFTAMYTDTADQQRVNLRTQFEQLRATDDLPVGGNYLIYFDTNFAPHFIFRYMEYEVESAHLYKIFRSEDYPGQFLAGYKEAFEPVSDVQEVLANTLESADALIIFDGSEEFEAELSKFTASHPVDTPVYFIHSK